MQQRILHLVLLATASLLASGCYCPMLSGRYGDCGFPPGVPANCVVPDGNDANDAACGPSHGCCLGMLFPGLLGAAGAGDNNVLSQQGPDYLSPQAKFHPVPTRPVFEPQPAYPPTELVEPGITSNPLRSTTATIATARAATLR